MKSQAFQTQLLCLAFTFARLKTLQRRINDLEHANDTGLVELKELKTKCTETQRLTSKLTEAANSVVEGNLEVLSKKRVAKAQVKIAEIEMASLYGECTELQVQIGVVKAHTQTIVNDTSLALHRIEDMQRDTDTAKAHLNSLKLTYLQASKDASTRLKLQLPDESRKATPEPKTLHKWHENPCRPQPLRHQSQSSASLICVSLASLVAVVWGLQRNEMI